MSRAKDDRQQEYRGPGRRAGTDPDERNGKADHRDDAVRR
jgi:hypothetical protein